VNPVFIPTFSFVDPAIPVVPYAQTEMPAGIVPLPSKRTSTRENVIVQTDFSWTAQFVDSLVEKDTTEILCRIDVKAARLDVKFVNLQAFVRLVIVYIQLMPAINANV